jgi:hypothetical protein
MGQLLNLKNGGKGEDTQKEKREGEDENQKP